MDKKSTKKNSGIIIGLLILLLLGAIAYSFMQNITIKNTQKAFETEKAIKIEELKQVQQEYDDFLAENQINETEIIATKIKLNRILDSVKNIKPNYKLVNELRLVRDNLKAKLLKLQLENKRLKEENLMLATQKDSVVQKLDSTLVVYQQTTAKNEELNQIVAKAQKLVVTSIENTAIRIKKSGKIVHTNRSSKVTAVEVCYEIPANTVAIDGMKEFYIQLVSPNKQVVGGKFYMNDVNGKTVNISKISKFRYQNKLIKVCDYVEPLPEEKFEAGLYKVHVFQGTNLISSSSILLK